MAERYFEEIMDPEFQAADFLRRSLVSHFHTGPVIKNLRAGDHKFQEEFTLAKTPFELLQAISASGSQRVIEVVDQFVDKWVHFGNNKNPTTTRQLIASAHDAWVTSLNEN